MLPLVHHASCADGEKDDPQRERDPDRRVLTGEVGDEAFREQLEDVGEGTDGGALKNRKRQPAEHQHPGKRDDEARDLEVGHPVALRGADQAADDEADDRRRDIVDGRDGAEERQPDPGEVEALDHQHGASPPTKPTIEPIERSMCPATMMSSMPSAMTTT